VNENITTHNHHSSPDIPSSVVTINSINTTSTTTDPYTHLRRHTRSTTRAMHLNDNNLHHNIHTHCLTDPEIKIPRIERRRQRVRRRHITYAKRHARLRHIGAFILPKIEYSSNRTKIYTRKNREKRALQLQKQQQHASKSDHELYSKKWQEKGPAGTVLNAKYGDRKHQVIKWTGKYYKKHNYLTGPEQSTDSHGRDTNSEPDPLDLSDASEEEFHPRHSENYLWSYFHARNTLKSSGRWYHLPDTLIYPKEYDLAVEKNCTKMVMMGVTKKVILK